MMFASGWLPFTITIISLVGPFLFKQLRAARREESADDDQPAKRSGRPILSLLLIANAIYILYTLLLHPPFNIFSVLRIPFTTPETTIRALLLQRTESRRDGLPPFLELLLTKLASFEVRTMYARFGHDTILKCLDCQNFLQFGLYALSTALVDYIRNICLYGLVTMRGTGRERLRLLGTGVLVTAAAFEAWWISTVDIQVPRDGLGVVMWHDRLFLARQVIFLIVPTIAHNLPASPARSISPFFLLSRTVMELDTTESKARTLDMTRGAAMRNPKLRQNVDRWWGAQQQESEWARAEVKLEEEAEKVGLEISQRNPETGEQEGRLLVKIKTAVRELGKLAWGWEDKPAD